MKKEIVRFVKLLSGTIFARAIRIRGSSEFANTSHSQGPYFSPDMNDLDDMNGHEVVLARSHLADNSPLFDASGTESFGFMKFMYFSTTRSGICFSFRSALICTIADTVFVAVTGGDLSSEWISASSNRKHRASFSMCCYSAPCPK